MVRPIKRPANADGGYTVAPDLAAGACTLNTALLAAAPSETFQAILICNSTYADDK